MSYDKNKTITSLLYICQELGGEWDLYSLMKILYFAEKKHLAKYGRTITGDNIVAMKYGPVPSECYDMLKANRIDENFFSLNDTIVSCNSKPDLDYLSESDLDCLRESIAENKHLGFNELKKKSHDSAYNWTVDNVGLNNYVSLERIAESAGANSHMLKYISLSIENDSLSLK